MKTITQELKQYMTHLFQLSNNEAWECEALEETAENILPERLLMILHWYNSHSRLIPTIMMSYMS